MSFDYLPMVVAGLDPNAVYAAQSIARFRTKQTREEYWKNKDEKISAGTIECRDIDPDFEEEGRPQ